MSSNGHGRRDVDGLLVAALAGGATYREAGQLVGVSKSTVKRRMAESDFRKTVVDERLELAETLRARLLAAAPNAVRTLDELATGATSEAVRLRAACAVLDLSLGRRRGFDLVEGREFERAVRAIVEAAARRLSDDEMLAFLREAEALVGPR